MPNPEPWQVADAQEVLLKAAIAKKDRAFAELSSAYTEHLMHLSTQNAEDIDDQVRDDELRTALFKAETAFVEAFNEVQAVMLL